MKRKGLVIELTNERFGKLLVVERKENNKSGSAMWLCICDCGNSRVVEGTGLRAGRNKSCGCASPRFKTENPELAGKSKSRMYLIWKGMIRRCSDSATGKSRRNYYEKGIRVCKRWESFANFCEDMGEPPSSMSLDRINGSGNYEPKNCRWATYFQQANNTASNVWIDVAGQKKTIAEWSRTVGVKQNTIIYRIRRGWSPERAVTEPLK